MTDILHVSGYFLAVLIGVVLGMLGGGGAVLAVPVLVYLMGVNTDLATAYSLFIVGLTALIGSVRFVRAGLVQWKTALLFLGPSMVAVLLTRRFVLPAIPEVVFHFFEHPITRKPLVMVLFALLMGVAGISMLRSARSMKPQGVGRSQAWMVIPIWGLVVGFLAGLLGAGGGFMIVPVFVMFLGIPMKTAVGTSITIIAIQSLIGFAGDLGKRDMDWPFLAGFTALSLIGLFLGIRFSKKVDPEKLKRVFGWFVLFLGSAIIAMEWCLND